jgi:hypothetical protein
MMSMKLNRRTARLAGVISVEDAEPLLQWLQQYPKGRVDLSRCTHIHAASLQALMVARPFVAAWPGDEGLAVWLRSALS